MGLLNIENMGLTQKKCALFKKSSNIILPRKEKIIFNSFTLGLSPEFYNVAKTVGEEQPTDSNRKAYEFQ